MRCLSFAALLFAVLCFSASSMAAMHEGHNPGLHNAGEHAGQVRAPQRKAPQLKDMGGQEVDNEYFKLVIPQGWSMPMPVKKGQGSTVVFASMDKQSAVNFNIVQTAAPAKDIAEALLANMKKSGVTATPLEEKDGMWFTNLSGRGRGVIWAGSNGSVACVTVIQGRDIAKANEILSALTAKTKGIFPAKAQ